MTEKQQMNRFQRRRMQAEIRKGVKPTKTRVGYCIFPIPAPYTSARFARMVSEAQAKQFCKAPLDSVDKYLLSVGHH